MARTRRWPLAAFAVWWLLAAACATEAEVNPLERVAGAAERTASVEAARLRMTADLSGSGISDGTVLDIDAMSAMDGSAAEGTMRLGDVPVDMLLVDGSYYYGFPDLPGGVDWVEITSSDLQEMGIDLEAAQQQQANQALALLAGSGEVEEVGREEIDGVDTTRYHVVADLVQVNAESGVFSEAMLDEMRGLLGGEVPLDVWIDGEGFVRQMVYEVDLAEAPDPPPGMPSQGRIEYRFHLSDFTDDYAPPDAPDPDRVIPIAEYRPGS